MPALQMAVRSVRLTDAASHRRMDTMRGLSCVYTPIVAVRRVSADPCERLPDLAGMGQTCHKDAYLRERL